MCADLSVHTNYMKVYGETTAGSTIWQYFATRLLSKALNLHITKRDGLFMMNCLVVRYFERTPIYCA